MRLKQEMRARSKRENHQDNYTKMTSLKFVFTCIRRTINTKMTIYTLKRGYSKNITKYNSINTYLN